MSPPFFGAYGKGVYTLLLHEIPVYVGQSANLRQRIHRHLVEHLILFDEMAADQVYDEGARIDLEAERIHALHPPLNRWCPRCRHYRHRVTGGGFRAELRSLGLLPSGCLHWKESRDPDRSPRP